MIDKKSNDTFSVKVYGGSQMALLSFDLKTKAVKDLAGFAIKCIPPGGSPYYLPNRINFPKESPFFQGVPEGKQQKSNLAPIQKFKWVHAPRMVWDGLYQYEITPMYFGQDALRAGASLTVSVDMTRNDYPDLDMAFTRGFINSQAYAEQFKNAPISPPAKEVSIDYDTAPFLERYQWLGAKARDYIFEMLDETLADPELSLDVFAYDLDEPDIIRKLKSLGSRLRLLLDNSADHGEADSLEGKAAALFASGDHPAQVKRHHFSGLQHNKIFIQKKAGVPVKVLTGSANFQVRGLYAQANNIFIFRRADVVQRYAAYFEWAFSIQKNVTANDITTRWFDFEGSATFPKMSVCFSPHKDPGLSLNKLKDAIDGSESSVLFAVMDIKTGKGKPLEMLRYPPEGDKRFRFGIIDKLSTKNVAENILYFDGKNSFTTGTDALTQNVPEPFKAETSGGSGHLIHHKFVVLDFNGKKPVVFTGSSNLAEGGESGNGDNLFAIYDNHVVTAFAVEAIRLIDHYSFRKAQNDAEEAQKELALVPNDSWTTGYYKKGERKYNERKLFIK